MAKANIYHDSDSGYLGGGDMHPETWRVHGNRAQMVDVSEHGPLSAATDDSGVSTCEKAYPNAPYFEGDSPTCKTGSLSGASDGAASSKRSAARLAEHARNAGIDIEGPDGVGSRIT